LKPLPVIKAIRVGSPQDLGKVSDYAGVQAILLDSKAGSSRGGTGILFPWDWLFNWRSPKPLFLAGGLRPDNVGEAIRTVRPYAVDVSSGVERSPGIKEASKLRRFMEEVSRAWNEA
jgi:phosphoribosylanthranilate isomerase